MLVEDEHEKREASHGDFLVLYLFPLDIHHIFDCELLACKILVNDVFSSCGVNVNTSGHYLIDLVCLSSYVECSMSSFFLIGLQSVVFFSGNHVYLVTFIQEFHLV